MRLTSTPLFIGRALTIVTLCSAFSPLTAPTIGLTDFVNNFSTQPLTPILASTPSPGTVFNVGNATETDGILASGWDFTITALSGNVTASVSGAGPGGTSDFCIRLNSTSGFSSVGVKSDNASAFDLQYVYFKCNIPGTTMPSSATIVLTGYRNGTAVTGATLSISGIITATWTKFDVSAIPAFNNVTEFRFTQSTTAPAATITFAVIDDIDIASAVPLPLTLTDFSGRRSGDNVLLDWTTVSEQNTSYFEIERGTDGSNFSAAGRVAAAGNSDHVISYQYTDTLPVAAAANWFYRLRMTDLDGQYTYSPILAIGAPPATWSLSAYPNPFQQQLNVQVQSTDAEQVNLQLTDMSGNILQAQSATLQKGSNILVLSSPGRLAPGVYLLVLSSPHGRQVIKVVKG